MKKTISIIRLSRFFLYLVAECVLFLTFYTIFLPDMTVSAIIGNLFFSDVYAIFTIVIIIRYNNFYTVNKGNDCLSVVPITVGNLKSFKKYSNLCIILAPVILSIIICLCTHLTFMA